MATKPKKKSVVSKIKDKAKNLLSKAKEKVSNIVSNVKPKTGGLDYSKNTINTSAAINSVLQKKDAKIKKEQQMVTTALTPARAKIATSITQKPGLMSYNTTDGKAPRSDGSNVSTQAPAGTFMTYNTANGKAPSPSNPLLSSKKTSQQKQTSSLADELSDSLGMTEAPRSAAGVNSLSSPSFASGSQSNMGLGNISGTYGDIAQLNQANELAIQEKQKSAEQLALESKEKESESWLEKQMRKMDRQDTVSERREDLTREYDIKSQIAGINEVTKQYEEAKAQVANQVALANDKLGTNNFINNQIQQIERNSAPILNKLSGEINFRTALLTQSQDAVEQAIQDYTADTKQQWDNIRYFYQVNQDTINRLDSRYKDALERSDKEAERIHKANEEDRRFAIESAVTYFRAGIKPTDSPEEVIAKIQKNPLTKSDLNGTKGTADERKSETISKFSSTFVPGARIGDVPVLDDNGFITPSAWREAISDAPSQGLTREDFVRNFGYLLYRDDDGVPDNSYSLTPVEKKLVTGEI